ncbi:hypothetical protein FACS1894102_5300 [Spirochaetia bacterium]|nr:hypothetical protein FACS1894102_5300 [Spirochaetia bacterium]
MKTNILSVCKLVLLLAVLNCAAIFAQEKDSNKLNVVKPVVKDKDLVIPVSEITDNAIFYPVDIDGVRLEVLIVILKLMFLY